MPYVAHDTTDARAILCDSDGRILISPLSGYEFMGFDDTTTANTVYVFKENKFGAWFVMRVNTSTGVVDYATGTSNLAAAVADPAGQSYDDFSAKF